MTPGDHASGGGRGGGDCVRRGCEVVEGGLRFQVREVIGGRKDTSFGRAAPAKEAWGSRERGRRGRGDCVRPLWQLRGCRERPSDFK